MQCIKVDTIGQNNLENLQELLETSYKYHPHGDQSVYDALVRMVQDFSMSLPLVDGQGILDL